MSDKEDVDVDQEMKSHNEVMGFLVMIGVIMIVAFIAMIVMLTLAVQKISGG